MIGCRRVHPTVWVGGAVLALVACEGVIVGSGNQGPGGPHGGGSPTGDAGASGTSNMGGTVVGLGGGDGGQTVAQPAPTTRFARLTHAQWERTVRDLFRLDDPTGLSEGFRGDPGDAAFLFDNNGLSLSVDEALWSGYQRAAVDLAEQITTDQARLDEILPPEQGDPRARAEQFVREFGKRAHRRPLNATQVEEYMALYDEAPQLYDGMSDFKAGIRLMLEAFLQSPYFLYRTELSTDASDGIIPLGGWEIASRLSYFLWDSMPDPELFELAESGALQDPKVVAEQARRMLEDPRAEHVLIDFHNQLLETEQYESIVPSDTFFPDVADDLGELAVRENDMFLRDQLIDDNGGWYDLLTSNRTFVNDDLADIYGLEGSFGDAFEPVELDPEKRAGLFTQIGFLASNATSRDPDPIHRGVFLAKRINCIKIAAPPEDIPPLPEPSDATNRKTIEKLTEKPGTVCASCHKPTINPFGFAFESYDAVGAWREEDRGEPVNTATEAKIDGEATPVSGALELIHEMANSRKVHECYVQHWVEYAFGRPMADEDEVLVQQLGEQSLEHASVREILVELVTSRAFLARSTEKL